MSDRGAIVMAIAAAAGALLGRPVPLWVASGVVVVAFVVRQPALLVVGVLLLSSTMSARSWAGLSPPQPAAIAGVATLVTDPETVAGALRVEARFGRRRVEAWARGGAAGSLYNRLAGERVELRGRLRPVPAAVRGRLARRHIAARVTVESVGRWWSGPPPIQAANAVRRTLTRGASTLPTVTRSLFAGFVLGDDREQPASVTDDFQGSGLTHLLVVSGENVAFVLLLAGPLMRRTGLRGRLVIGLCVLLAFGLITRWEPSVLRAEAMATVALAATTLGRQVSTVRVLALAVTALLLIDPMLVRSVGFLLSVGACAGIALFAQRVADRVPGPRAVAAAIGVTVGAQLGVAPVLVPVFGPMPLATLPANLLAVPAAGPIMVWGMTAGVVAGVMPTFVAAALHVPTRVLISWVALVARVSSRLPLGRVTLVHLAAAAGAVLMLTRVGQRRLVAAVVAGVILLSPTLTWVVRARPTLTDRELVPGLRAWRSDGATVLVVGEARPVAALAAFREHRVGRADVVVATSASRTVAELLAAIRARVVTRAVLGPGGIPVTAGQVVTIGPLRITVVADAPRLEVAVCTQRGATVAPCS